MLRGRCDASEMGAQNPSKVKIAFRILILCIRAERDDGICELDRKHKVIIGGSMTPRDF
jgi:hypothetical protein